MEITIRMMEYAKKLRNVMIALKQTEAIRIKNKKTYPESSSKTVNVLDSSSQKILKRINPP